jgi:hypothetical protein
MFFSNCTTAPYVIAKQYRDAIKKHIGHKTRTWVMSQGRFLKKIPG